MCRNLTLALAALCFAACGDKAPPSAPAAGGAADQAAASKKLGNVTIAGHKLGVVRIGNLVQGQEGTFEVSIVQGPAGADLAKLKVLASLEEQGGTNVSATAEGAMEKGKLRFQLTPRANAAAPVRFVLRVKADGGVEERGSLPLSGHGHEHAPKAPAATPHDGIVAAFQGPDGQVAGHLELKLHDDKGDLELWIAKDANISQPLDLPLDSKVRVTFIDFKDKLKPVDLEVRNKDKNEDEDGTPNVRKGKTNYFIFPGESGQDAAWLMGANFQSKVRVTFTSGATTYTSEEFRLVPHGHADDSTPK